MTDVNYENIERYLSGNMTDKERLHFEEELDENAELAQELRFYLYVNRSINECLSVSPVKSRWRGFHQGTFNQFSIMSSVRWMALIAIVALLAFSAIWTPWKRHAEPEKVKMNKVSPEGIPVDPKYDPIIQLFNAGKYKEVLPLLNTAVSEHPDDLYFRYYRGLTTFHLNYLGSARRDLLKVYTENAVQMYDAAYYIALSYTLEEEDYTESARKWLDKIPSDSPVFAKAEALREKL